jgi:hypothetical protein
VVLRTQIPLRYRSDSELVLGSSRLADETPGGQESRDRDNGHSKERGGLAELRCVESGI